jgi:hypothetical protein
MPGNMAALAGADPTLASLDLFDDPSRWVVVKNVPVFRPHKRYGRNKDGDKVLLYEVTQDTFDRVAAEMIDLEQDSGVIPRMTLGHIEPAQPETSQPPIVGWGRDLKRGTFGPSKVPALLADLYYRVEDWPEASKYPFRSVEYYPNRGTITGIALLKRDPELDLGALIFERGQEPCYYYSAESAMPAEPDKKPPESVAKPAAPPAAAPGVPGADDAEYTKACAHMERYMKEKYPHLSRLHGEAAQRYEAATAFPAAGGTPPAPAAGPGLPSSTNAAPPRPAAPPVPQPTAARMDREEQAIQYRQLEERLAVAERQLESERYERRLAQCNQAITQLQGEGYPIRDRVKLVTKLAKMTEPEAAEFLDDYRVLYSGARIPVRAGFITPSPTAGPNGDNQEVTESEAKAAARLATAEGIGYKEALVKVRSGSK